MKQLSEQATSLEPRFAAAQSFAEYVRDAHSNADLWVSLARRAQVPAAVLDEVCSIGGQWHLLALSEDWCGDAVNSLPVLAKLAELVDNIDLRILPRDTNLDLMDSHLSPRGGRAIPVVMVLDADFVERGWWGSRPAELQRWIDDVGHAMPKEDRYREVRKWYARNRGADVLSEVVAIVRAAAREARAA
jgi:hypothetical protein